MKRYIKASITSSAPDWLRTEFTRRFGSDLKNKLISRYHIAIDKANFTSSPNSSSDIPIYYLQTDNWKEVYCPGANDDDTAYVNGRNRKLGSITKSKLSEMAIDIVYVDPTNPDNLIQKRERYQDPRYSYRYSSKGEYVGQYQRQDYLGRGEDGESQYGPMYWSESGKTPSNESRARDKSGYKIPSPAQMISQYYKKFPDRITNKIDRIYDRMVDVRQQLMNVDFNNTLSDQRYENNHASVYRRFSEVISDYRKLFEYLDADRHLKNIDMFDGDSYYVSEMSKLIRSIQQDLNEIEAMINS